MITAGCGPRETRRRKRRGRKRWCPPFTTSPSMANRGFAMRSHGNQGHRPRLRRRDLSQNGVWCATMHAPGSKTTKPPAANGRSRLQSAVCAHGQCALNARCQITNVTAAASSRIADDVGRKSVIVTGATSCCRRRTAT